LGGGILALFEQLFDARDSTTQNSNLEKAEALGLLALDRLRVLQLVEAEDVVLPVVVGAPILSPVESSKATCLFSESK